MGYGSTFERLFGSNLEFGDSNLSPAPAGGGIGVTGDVAAISTLLEAQKMRVKPNDNVTEW
jgi:hypothetical protein